MSERVYRVVFAKTVPGLKVAATKDYTILKSTIRQFQSLDSKHDLSFQPMRTGTLNVKAEGYVALSYKEV